jgi:hypothetical protein
VLPVSGSGVILRSDDLWDSISIVPRIINLQREESEWSGSSPSRFTSRTYVL